MPEYNIHPGDIMVMFKAAPGRVIDTVSSKGTVRGTVEDTVTVTESEQAILNLLTENPAYTYEDLMKRMHLGRKAIASRIKSLKNKGMIKRVGSDQSGHWQVKNLQ